MEGERKSIEFYFQPFKGLEFKKDVPVVVIVFENQPDLILKQSFPEIEATRARFEKRSVKEDEPITYFHVTRNDEIIPIGMIYIRDPWRRHRNAGKLDVDKINFYREVWERVALASRALRALKHTKFELLLPSRFQPDNIARDRLQERRLEKFCRTIAEAVVAGNNTLDEFLARKDPPIETVTVNYFGQGGREVDEFFRRSITEGRIIGEASGYVRRLTMLPPNRKYPALLMSEAFGAKPRMPATTKASWHKLAQHAFSSRTKVSYLYGRDGIEKFGMGLVAAVGQGSIHEPVFVKAHYSPDTAREKPVKKVVLIGKGVTHDTGGISLKDNEDQSNIHYDMAGAATAFGVLRLAEVMQLPVEIVVLAPLVENAIGHRSSRRHDIVRAYNGKTVEVRDPDAEGRLILADAIAYSERHLRADCTVTIGTLADLSDFGPDLIKAGVGNDKMRGRLKRAEWDSCEKMFLMPSIERLNWVDNEHMGDVSDWLQEPKGVYYHTAPFTFLANFFPTMEPEWAFIDVSAVFPTDADDYGAGPGFGLKFVWNLVKQYA